jgi:hypothetical protein
MPTDAEDRDDDASDKPTLRQRLHSATGDRDAEAKALADRAGDEVSVDDAKTAVQRAHGDLGAGEPTTDSDIAAPADAEAVHEERSS